MSKKEKKFTNKAKSQPKLKRLSKKPQSQKSQSESLSTSTIEPKESIFPITLRKKPLKKKETSTQSGSRKKS